MSSPLDFLSHPESPDEPVRRLPAWLVPAGILVGFGLLFTALYRDRLLPAPTVEVAAVLATNDAALSEPTDGNAAAPPLASGDGALLFQASGWIEPEPYPTKVPVLVDGVIAEVHVLEGQSVEKGELLATLVDDDAKLALAAAQGRHRVLKSSLQAHRSSLEAIRKKHEASQAEAKAAKTLEAEAGHQQARFDRVAKSGGVSELEAITARLRLQREKSLHHAAQAKGEELGAEVQRVESELQVKENELTLAAVAVEQAELALKRTRLYSPIKGRVLRLLAAPGEKKILMMDGPESSAICTLYEPGKLQARVDVPLANAAQLQVGQKVKVHTSLFSNKVFDGEVTRITGEADLQRNTLQAKVRILNPADQLRPEMLCRVEFFGGGGGETSASPSGLKTATSLSLWIPSSAYQDGSVWVYDPDTKRLTRRAVQTGNNKRDDYLQVTEGLRPGEQVVITPGNWREGQRAHFRSITP